MRTHEIEIECATEGLNFKFTQEFIMCGADPDVGFSQPYAELVSYDNLEVQNRIDQSWHEDLEASRKQIFLAWYNSNLSKIEEKCRNSVGTNTR